MLEHMDNLTLSRFGLRMRRERLRKRLSLYQLAVRAGVHPNSVALAERGAVSLATYKRIVAALRGAPEGKR